MRVYGQCKIKGHKNSGSIPRNAVVCHLRKIAMRDFQESVTTGQTEGQTDAGQSDPYVPLCFADDKKFLDGPNPLSMQLCIYAKT